MEFTDLKLVGVFQGVSVYQTKNEIAKILGYFFSTWMSINGEIAPCIMVHPCVEEFLSEEEISAIFYHELGHILSDHLDMEGKSKISFDLSHEIEADRFATNYISAKVLVTALKKIFAYSYKQGGFHKRMDVVKTMFLHYKRIKILKNMERLGV